MEQKKFLDFLDRIDGGGAGGSGDRFEGGGLLSLLGNAFAKPYGSQDERRAAARSAFYSDQMGEQAPMAAPAAPVRTSSQMATQPNYADRFAVAPQPAMEPNYADRFGVAPSTPTQPQPSFRSIIEMLAQPDMSPGVRERLEREILQYLNPTGPANY